MPDLELKVGERRVLELRGLGSAGYTWEAQVDGPDGVVEVRTASSGVVERPPSGGPPPANTSLPELVELTALRPGEVRVRLALRRSWEQGVAPLEEDEFAVVVAD